MIASTVLLVMFCVVLVMFCVVLAFVLVGINPCDSLPELRRKTAQLFRKKDENESRFIETMKRYDEILLVARHVLEKYDGKDIVSVDSVKVKGENAVIEFTYKWGLLHEKGKCEVPIDEIVNFYKIKCLNRGNVDK